VRGGAGRYEDSCADNRSDPERRELHGTEDAAKAVFAPHFVEQHGQRLSDEQLTGSQT
jgi:hypothetical protein